MFNWQTDVNLSEKKPLLLTIKLWILDAFDEKWPRGLVQLQCVAAVYRNKEKL